MNASKAVGVFANLLSRVKTIQTKMSIPNWAGAKKGQEPYFQWSSIRIQ